MKFRGRNGAIRKQIIIIIIIIISIVIVIFIINIIILGFRQTG